MGNVASFSVNDIRQMHANYDEQIINSSLKHDAELVYILSKVCPKIVQTRMKKQRVVLVSGPVEGDLCCFGSRFAPKSFP